MQPRAIGVDFGTTNSVVAYAFADGSVRMRELATPSGLVDAYRSALLFYRAGALPDRRIAHVSGPEALERAQDISEEHRFLQSLKTHLSSRAFTDTRLFGQLFTLEKLIATFLSDILPPAAERKGIPVVVGRPVVFAGERPDEELAVTRLRAAFGQAGVEDVTLAYEPLGAAWWYASKLRRAETVLIADFGGGTSDFSVMRFERDGEKISATPLAHAGVGIAGDTFDFRILDAVVSPHLGKDSRYRSFGKLLPMPVHYHAAFAQWHRLSLLKSRETMLELRKLQRDSERPDEIEDLITVIDHDLGYALYRAVSATKLALTEQSAAPFRFERAGISIVKEVERTQFESWIAPDIARIGETIDAALAQAGLGDEALDTVFMTGGTSLVPAVRALFSSRFGEAKLHDGDAFRSVAGGLALFGAKSA